MRKRDGVTSLVQRSRPGPERPSPLCGDEAVNRMSDPEILITAAGVREAPANARGSHLPPRLRLCPPPVRTVTGHEGNPTRLARAAAPRQNLSADSASMVLPSPAAGSWPDDYPTAS